MGKPAIRSSSLSGTRQEAEDVTSSQNEKQKGKGVASSRDEMLRMMDGASFGLIVDTSISNGSLGLDWALVELIGDKPSQVNEYLYDNKVLSIHGIAMNLPSRSPVLAILAQGAIAGMILGTSVSMRLPGSRKMCEVWTVNLNEPIGMASSSTDLHKETTHSDYLHRRGRLWGGSYQSSQWKCLRPYRRRKHWHRVCLCHPFPSNASRNFQTTWEQEQTDFCNCWRLQTVDVSEKGGNAWH